MTVKSGVNKIKEVVIANPVEEVGKGKHYLNYLISLSQWKLRISVTDREPIFIHLLLRQSSTIQIHVYSNQ